MAPELRREQILALLEEHRRVSVTMLASALDASHETIRRDLSLLADRGLVRKVHGGAMLPSGQGEGSFRARLGEQTAAKRRIAKAAAALYRPGDTLFVDNGTTTLAFAEELAKVGGITVVTNGTLIAGAMTRANSGSQAGRGAVGEVFLVGGSFAEDGAETIGPFAHEQLRRFHAEHAVLTIGALDAARGVMDYNLGEAEVARVMIEQASVVTVIADSSKLGRTALFQVCPISSISRLVTDLGPPPDLAQALESAGVEVIIATEEPPATCENG